MMKRNQKHSERAGRCRAPGVGAVRLIFVALALVVVLWAAACGDENVVEPSPAEDAIIPQLPFMPLLPALELEEIDLLLRTNARGWQTLSADCRAIIRNLQIQAPNNQAAFSEGHIWYEKPGRVHLALGYDGQTRLRVIGNGTKYRADLTVFNDAYSGDYSEIPLPAPGRISLLAPDLVAALDPVRVLASTSSNLGATLVQWEQVTGLLMLDYDEAASGVWPRSSIWLSRRTRDIETIERYRVPGKVASRIRYFGLTAASASEGNVVRVPNLVAIQYPEEQTTISLTLTDVTLDGKLPEDIFSLSR